jgi:hypothetical protein
MDNQTVMDNFKLNYKNLNTKSDFLKYFQPIADEIEKLANGGIKLKAEDYLLVRDHEKADIKKARVKKFAPKNVLGAALKYLRIFQESGAIQFDVDNLPGDSAYWETFISSVDGTDKTLKEFVIDIFETATKVKYAFVKVDLPYTDLPEQISLYDAETTLKNVIPFLTEISIADVLSYSCDIGDNLDWIKYRHIEAIEDPLQGTIYNYDILIVDKETIQRFTFPNVQLKEDGTVNKIFDPSINRGNGGYRQIKPTDEPIMHPVIRHNRNACPILKFELPDSLWQANQVYKTQAVIHGLGMNMLHTLANAGFIQKWGEPYLLDRSNFDGTMMPTPPNILAEKLNVSQKNEQTVKSLGDESVILMNKFSFEEITGSSIEIQDKILKDMCDYIFNTIIYKQNILNKTVNIQTGTAKEFDREAQTLALKANGKKIIALTQQILKQVARCQLNISDKEINSISVTGMSEFNLKPVDSALDTVTKLHALKPDIPGSLWELALIQLAVALTENDSQAFKQDILADITTKTNKSV